MTQFDLFPADPDPAEVRRRQLIAEAEERGDLVPSCDFCRDHLYPRWPDHEGPRHKPSCGSPHSHCTCDTCF